MYAAASEEDEDGSISEENFNALCEIFNLMNTPNLFEITPCVPVYTYNVTFFVDKNDIYIEDDELYFKNVYDCTLELDNQIRIYVPNESVNDFNSLIATGDKTNIVLNNPKGKDIINEFASTFYGDNISNPEEYGGTEIWVLNCGYEFEEI